MAESSIFVSPKVVGGADFVITTQTVAALMGSAPALSLNLMFTKFRNSLPAFGVSTVPAKALVSLTAQRQCAVSKLGVVKIHEWLGHDKSFWSKRFVDNNNPVIVTFRRDGPLNSDAINMSFSYKDIQSLSYSYSPNRLGCDVYFVIFEPKAHIDEGRFALLSNFDFFSRLSDGVRSAAIRSDDEESKAFTTECITCYSKLAEIVFIPCGHSSFCRKCSDEYHSSACAMCKQPINSRVQARRAAKFCLTCPLMYDCKVVNAMLLPCHCVVGCMETARRTVGDPCINCETIVTGVQQVYT